MASLLLIQATANDYDPWCDTNDDGEIDIFDVVDVATRYGTTGTAINKTELLLDLQARVEALEEWFLPGATFIPSSEFVAALSTQLYELHENNLRGIGYFRAGVNLPDGVTITNLTMYVYNNDYLGLMHCLSLYRVHKTENTTDLIAQVYSFSPVATPFLWFNDNIGKNGIVDNEKYSYILWLEIPDMPPVPDLQFYWAQVEYEY